MFADSTMENHQAHLDYQPRSLEQTASNSPLRLNMILLGETGVGKSTWINGFANYLNYETLEEAEQGKLVSVIPTKFTLTDADYNEETYCSGQDENEVHEEGASSTQLPKTYVIESEGVSIRLVDTPGIGDTRGIERDKENFQQIMDHIASFDVLHGICILLESNKSRLTPAFEYCIKELLANLHVDACRNIVFCFTKCRTANYGPGSTLTILRKLLTEELNGAIDLDKSTIYCFDNDSFRYLVALKEGKTFDEREQLSYVSSWGKSVTETERLVKHISEIVPHDVKDTLSINNSRIAIESLIEPLSDISTNVLENIESIEKQKHALSTPYKNKEELDSKLYIYEIDMRTIPIPASLYVCEDSECKYEDQFENVTSYEYRCTLTSIQFITELVNRCFSVLELHELEKQYLARHSRFKFWLRKRQIIDESVYAQQKVDLEAASGPKCKMCGHHYDDHKCISYYNEKVVTKVTDPEIETLLKKEGDEIAALERTKTILEKRGQQFVQEREKIIDIISQFACFLKQNAIVPYNDAIEEYLKCNIKVAKGKANSSQLVAGLEDMLKVYIETVRVMKENSCSITLKPDDILRLIDELYNLKHSGPKLKNIMKVTEACDVEITKAREVKIALEAAEDEKVAAIKQGLIKRIRKQCKVALMNAVSGKECRQPKTAST